MCELGPGWYSPMVPGQIPIGDNRDKSPSPDEKYRSTSPTFKYYYFNIHNI